MSKTGHITFLLPLSGVLCLESVMSDKMCGCVCAPTVYKLGSQIDFSVFSAPLFGIFDVSQCTCSQNQCLFPFHLLVPLPCSQTYMLPLPFSACFLRLAWICVPPSCQIPLLFGCLDLEPNTAVNTVRAKSKHHEVLARSIKKQRCLLCS